MKANKAEQQALITLLSRIYGEIRVIEEQWDIRAGVEDFRPRIEYFHDAIRAMTAGGNHGYERTGRLSIEFLAYDISMLRHIQANPMKKPQGAKIQYPPGTNVTLPYVHSPSGGKTDQIAKYELIDLYKNYSVLFVALLSDSADRNHQNRVSECNTEVEEVSALEKKVRAQATKSNADIDIETLAGQTIDDPDVLRKLLATLKSKKLKAADALRVLKDMIVRSDKEIRTVEQAHFTYVTSQLAIYEGARDVVKKMAMSGMNIVGDFVQNAVSEATRGQRGR